MAQKQVQSCKTLVCYTVDSDDTDDSDEDEEGKEKAQESFGDVIIKEEPGEQQDFGDIRIKEEPDWCVDTEGYIEPQDKMVVEFSEPQVKVEIVSESEESSDESSSESSSEEEEEAAKKEA